MTKGKGRGWFKDSERHADAARGIKTAKPKMSGKSLDKLATQLAEEIARARKVKTATTRLRKGFAGSLPSKLLFHFVTAGLTQKQAGDAILFSDIGEYNNFKPWAVADTLKSMRLDLGEVHVGLEGSPVIYFDGASPKAVNAFLKNLKRRNPYGPEEFGGPVDVPVMERNTYIGTYQNLRNPEHFRPKTNLVWRLWWD